jgi:homoserine kinase
VAAVRVRVRAPASTANLGPGFDAFALALEEPYDLVEASPLDEGVVVEVAGPYRVPEGVEENAAGYAARALLEGLGLRAGVRLRVVKGVPPGLGLGSSAASAAGAVFAVKELLDLDLDREELVGYAAEGERVSAGVGHRDNVAAALLGGFVIATPQGRTLHLDPPGSLGLAFAIPRVKVPDKKTGVARSVLPDRVPLEDLVANVAAASLIAAGMATGNLEVLREGLVDRVVEPARSRLVPGYQEVRSRALEAGALGVVISGAGPTMLALYDRERVDGRQVAAAMVEGFAEAGVEAEAHVTRPGRGVVKL